MIRLFTRKDGNVKVIDEVKVKLPGQAGNHLPVMIEMVDEDGRIYSFEPKYITSIEVQEPR